MRPKLPTPQETAQWIIETHAENIAWEMTDQEHAGYLSELQIVVEEMDIDDLRRTLGAVVDIAQELVIELLDLDDEPDRLLRLVRKGRGRVHVTRGLPSHPSAIGGVAALRLAGLIARTRLWTHASYDCDDDRLIDAYETDCEQADAAIAVRPLAHLLLVGDYLHRFSETLRDAMVSPAPKYDLCVSPDGATCRGHIDDWAAAIDTLSETWCLTAGSTERVWELHKEFFTQSV